MSPSPHNIPTQTTFTLCRFQDVALGLEWLVLCQKYGLRDLGWYVSYDLGNQVGAEEGGGKVGMCLHLHFSLLGSPPEHALWSTVICR